MSKIPFVTLGLLVGALLLSGCDSALDPGGIRSAAKRAR